MATKYYFDHTGKMRKTEIFQPEPSPDPELETPLVPDDITQLQLAVAELAAMIAGGDDNG